MRYEKGQALIEFIIIVPFLFILMFLPFVLSDMMEKKYRQEIATGNIANMDILDKDQKIDEKEAEDIQTLSVGFSIDGEITYITPKVSSLKRRSHLYKDLSKSLDSDSKIYNPIVDIEAFFGENYSYFTYVTGLITGLTDTESIAQVTSHVQYKINPTEIDLLLKSTDPTKVDESSTGLPLSLDFVSLNFNETLTGYHPSDYKRGGLIGWVLGSFLYTSGTKWGGSSYDYSYSNLEVHGFDSSSIKNMEDFKDVRSAITDTLGSIMPGTNSKDQDFSIACPFQYRATNECQVKLFGIGQPLYPELIELLTGIAAIADVIEEIATLGEAYGGKEALKESLKAIANELLTAIAKKLEDEAKAQVKDLIEEKKQEIEEKIKQTYQAKVADIKNKANDFINDAKAKIEKKSSSMKDKGVEYFEAKATEFAEELKKVSGI